MQEDTRPRTSLRATRQKEKRSKKAERGVRARKRVDKARQHVRPTSRPTWKSGLVAAAALALVVGGAWTFSTLMPRLPPTEMEGHTEDLLRGHILSTPMPELIQRHMLEHADGKGPPGVIVQYNCEDYVCEPDLVERLETLVRRYGAYVYLAPNDYDGKIILTKLGALQILEEFDQRRIETFIGR